MNILIIKGDPQPRRVSSKEKATIFVFSCQIMSTNFMEMTETELPSSGLKTIFKT